MLTNKKISLLIIVLSLFFISCSDSTNNVVNNNVKNEDKEIIKNIDGGKDKSLGGISLDKKNITESVSSSDLDFNK